MSNRSISLSTAFASAVAGVMAFALSTPAANAQINIRIGTPPPPLRYEVRPAMPGPGYAWSEGYWEPWQGRYRWHPGVWAQPPYQGGYYVHPHYDHYPDGWHMHEGYWSHEDHDNHYWDKHGDKHEDKQDKQDKHDDDRDKHDH